MAVRLTVVIGYFVVLLGIGLLARRRYRGTSEDYFLASRTLSPLVLFLTMAATNFSAFTVFGFSGAGWESGYAYYPIMAFGTGFMALTFVLIGRPAWRLGKEYGLVTPPEMVFHLTGSAGLRTLFFLVMAVFTVPYLAMQPMAAGYALQSLLGIPYFAGASLITAVMLLYTFLGGFRGVTWTDVFQGGMLITLLLVALAIIAHQFGGLAEANRAVAGDFPELFARPGLGGIYTPGVWLGYMLLWFLCDPMFPQLFQRFYAARGQRGLTATMTVYPLLTGFLFLLPVTIGVIGRLSFPTLAEGTKPDQILPLLLHTHTSPVVEALVLTAALAALMSTLDSQLLTLSSMFAKDIWEPLRERFLGRSAQADLRDNDGRGEPLRERFLGRSAQADLRDDDRSGESGKPAAPSIASDASPWVGKAFVAALALIGLAIAWQPPDTFRVLATKTFTGLAVLFPTAIAVLYWKRTSTAAAIASILVGEGMVVAYHFGLLPTFGTLEVVPIVVATTLVLIAGSLILRSRPRQAHAWAPSSMSKRARIGWALAFAALFVVSNDFWAWEDGRLWLLGFPWWVWMSAGLCVLTSGAFWLFGRRLDAGA